MSVFFIDSSKRAPLLPHKQAMSRHSPPAAPLLLDRPIYGPNPEADNMGWDPSRLLILPCMAPANHKSVYGFSLLERGESMAFGPLTVLIWTNI